MRTPLFEARARFAVVLLTLTAVSPALAESTAEFSNRLHSGFVSAELGGSVLGAQAFAEAGIESTGIDTFGGRRGLVQWDGDMAARGGVLVKSLPVLPLVGGRARASGELGYRFSELTPWSGYLGIGLDAGVQVMGSTQVSFPQLNSLGALDDVGGLSTGGAVRVAAGVSHLSGQHSWVLTAFAQSQLHLAAVGENPIELNGGGVRARWDIAHRLIASLEVFVGVSPRVGFSPLELTRQTLEETAAGSFRYVFADAEGRTGHSWIGAEASLAQANVTARYSGSQTYRTSSAPALAVSVQYGLSFGSR